MSPCQIRGDRVLLNLFCPFVNFCDLGIPIESLNLVFIQISVTSEEFNGFFRDFYCRSSRMHLGHGGQLRIDSLLVVIPGRFVGQESGRFNFSCHLCQFVLSRLKIDQLLSELLPVFDVIEGSVESPLADAKGLGCNLNPAFVEEFEDLVKSFVLFADEMGDRNLDVVEGELSRGGHPYPHLRFDLGCREALGSFLDEQGTLSTVGRLGIGIGLAEDDKEVCKGSIGDERLGPIDDKKVSLSGCRRKQERNIASVIRFGIGAGRDRFSSGNRDEILFAFVPEFRSEGRLPMKNQPDSGRCRFRNHPGRVPLQSEYSP